MSYTFDDVCGVIVTRGDRPEEVAKLAAELPYGEVVVWDNSKGEDLKCYGRYRAAERSKRPVIYFQDDDVRFTAHEDLLHAFNRNPDKLVANMYDEWINGCGYFDIALPGLGSLQKNWLWYSAFEKWDEVYSYVHEREAFLSYCDQIYGILTPWKRWDFGHEILDAASDGTRMWQQPGNFEAKWDVIHKARALRKVCLVMLVKDEEENVVRALESSKNLWDRALIIDTGSTDRTLEVIEDWWHKSGKWMLIEERPWVNYGHNRTELLNQARRELGCDYLLMMDADEELVDLPENGWPELNKDAFLLHYAGTVDFVQPRLISVNFPFEFDKTPVHAALTHTGGVNPSFENLSQPKIEHHGWDRHDEAKTLQDIELLNIELDAGREYERNLYNRAKAYEGVNMFEKAMDDFEELIEVAQPPNEHTWYAKFRLGVMLIEQKGKFPEGADYLMQAYLDRPKRIESLRALAHFCTAIADAAPYPEDELLIVFREQYSGIKQP